MKDFTKINAFHCRLKILQKTELQESKRSLYNKLFHKFVLRLLYTYICQAPRQTAVGMKLVCKYIAY